MMPHELAPYVKGEPTPTIHQGRPESPFADWHVFDQTPPRARPTTSSLRRRDVIAMGGTFLLFGGAFSVFLRQAMTPTCIAIAGAGMIAGGALGYVWHRLTRRKRLLCAASDRAFHMVKKFAIMSAIGFCFALAAGLHVQNETFQMPKKPLIIRMLDRSAGPIDDYVVPKKPDPASKAARHTAPHRTRHPS